MRRSLVLACSFLVLPACGGAASGDDGAGGSGGQPQQTTIAHGLRISEIAIYQGVKVPLVVEGQPAPHSAPVVQGRDGLLRVFVALEPDWVPREVIVRLEIDRGGTSLPPVELRRVVTGPSVEADFMSGFNFDVPGADLTGDFSYRVGIYETSPTTAPPTPGAVYPAQGKEAMGAVQAGALEVVLVPIQYNADGSGRLPDTGPAQVEKLRSHMYKTYPVSAVNIFVREPMQWNYTVGAYGQGWSELLQQLMFARSQDNPAVNVYYYGAFQPASSFFQYCQQGCVAGLSAGGIGPNDDWGRASLGVLYNGDYSAGTFIHEVGHAHGREHAPCAPGGQIESVDPYYPYPQAQLGSWGYDVYDHQLVEPTGARDFMSYCDPTWVSDYTYSALFDRVSLLNSMAYVHAGAPKAYRMLSVNVEGAVSAGPRLELRLPPSGQRRRVDLLDGAGALVGSAEASFHPYDHLPGGILLIPEPEAKVRRIRTGGHAAELPRR